VGGAPTPPGKAGSRTGKFGINEKWFLPKEYINNWFSGKEK
jgi:hypothetical protein